MKKRKKDISLKERIRKLTILIDDCKLIKEMNPEIIEYFEEQKKEAIEEMKKDMFKIKGLK